MGEQQASVSVTGFRTQAEALDVLLQIEAREFIMSCTNAPTGEALDKAVADLVARCRETRRGARPLT